MDAAARGEVWRAGRRQRPRRRGRRLAGRARADRLAGAGRPAPSPRPGTAGAARTWSDRRPTTTLLLRHGQTALSVQKRFSGVGDQPLTEVGLAQAAAAAARLAGSGATAVVSSPVRRARETAELVAEALGVEVALEPGLRETDFGDWEGYTFARGAGRSGRARWTPGWPTPSVAPPFGESFDAHRRRACGRPATGCSRRTAGSTVVLVSHVTPIKTLLRFALDAPPSALYRMHLDLACLSRGAVVRRRAGGRPVVQRHRSPGRRSVTRSALSDLPLPRRDQGHGPLGDAGR